MANRRGLIASQYRCVYHSFVSKFVIPVEFICQIYISDSRFIYLAVNFLITLEQHPKFACNIVVLVLWHHYDKSKRFDCQSVSLCLP